MSENYTTRISQAPDWLISGLVKSAVSIDESKDQPMLATGVSWNQLKAQIKSLLQRSGLNLTAKEIGVATYWLTTRTANNVSAADTVETLTESMNHFVAQYIVDKSVQRITGVSERSPIHTREWYDQNYGPASGTEKDASANSSDDSMPQVFVGIDGDDIGHMVEDTLLTDDPEAAARVSDSIHEAHAEIGRVVKERGGRLIFDGGDNMLFTFPPDTDAVEEIRKIYKDKTGHSATVGVGKRPIEAHFALVVGKNTGKDKTVVYGEEVLAEYEAIREEQEEAAPLLQKLKYKAEAADQSVNRTLTAVMGKMGLPADEESVYEMFMHLVILQDLGDANAIRRFFASGTENIERAISQMRAQRMACSWITPPQGAKFMTLAAPPTSAPKHFPGQSVPPGGRVRKSPHQRRDWLTIDDYNKDQVDSSKTDVSYVGGNVPKDSQMMVGGDPGDAIYVP